MNRTRLPTRQVPVVVRSCSHLIVTQPSRYNFGARSVHKRDHTGRRWLHASRNWATMPTVETAEAPGTSGIDTLLEKLSSKKAEWARLPVENKISILREVRQRLLHQPVAWAKASAQLVKRDSSEEGWVGEMLALVITLSSLIDGLLASLTAFQRTGSFPSPPSRTSASGQTVVNAFPWGWRQSKLDLLGAAGVSVDLFLQPGRPPSQGHFYTQGGHQGRVCVALGAGNQHFLALSDVLHQLFVEGCVVALKYHPIQAPVAPFIDYVLEPLSSRGYLATTLCNLPATRALLYHPLTDCVHMTGGTATHDAIVWGEPGEEQEGRKARDDPLLKVPISSELGCVTPWLVVPGPWTDAELDHHAQALAQAVVNNCSCNCLAAKVVMVAEGWEQFGAFMDKFKAELGKFPLPSPYYPGIRDRYAAFQQRYPSAEPVRSSAADPSLPCGDPLPVLVNVLDSYPAHPQQEEAFRVEPFAPVVTFVKVPVDSSSKEVSLEEGFLRAAVPAANTDLWGSLSCTLLVHPDTEARYGRAVQQAIDELQYGSVCVNVWSVLGFAVAPGHWGAFQGDQTLKDVGSGLGTTHNTYMYDHPQKTVVRTPFMSGVHPMPPSASPLPPAVAKAVVGLTHSGVGGLLRMLFAAK